MYKKLLLGITGLFAVCSVYAQISFSSTDMPTAGWTQAIVKDTLPLPTVNYGNKGANQVYNFSNLVQYKIDTAKYLALTPTQQTHFPNADLAVTSDNSTYLFTRNQTAKLDAEGIQGVLGGNVTYANFSPVDDAFHFPTTYGTNFSGNWGFIKTVSGASVGQPLADSVRVTFTDRFTDTIDGWGKTITPVGAYKSLREKRVEYKKTVIDARICIIGCSWSNVSTTYDTLTSYAYLAKETKGQLVTFDYDSLNNMIDAKYSLIPPAAPTAHFTYASGGGGLENFTDGTDGYPTKYHWSFGDGDTSNAVNPSHVYSANGAYYVCETVYNAGGSNTYCDSVHITGIVAGNNAPVAFNDTATIQQGSSTTVNVTANDVDPDNNTLCISQVYGSAFFTKASCSSITYAPDTTFSGQDSCYYVVCDNGSPSKCDTAKLVVTVTPKPTYQPPVANNDAVSTLQPGSTTVNAGANDTDPNGAFCITSITAQTPAPSYFSINGGNCKLLDFHADSTFTGNDTCWYVICDNTHTNLCDTAMAVVTVNPNPALLPVAGFYTHTYLCEGVEAINTSQNADSISWNLHCINCLSLPDTSFQNLDSIQYGNYTSSAYIQVCLTVFNKFGNSSLCDTAMTMCEGINELALQGISIYPNPANNYLTVDMRNNNDDITKNYSSIEIFNTLGEMVKTINNKNNNRLVNISVSGLSQGMYMAAIADANGTLRMLGRFMKE
jgi:PKD repeat protein